MMNPRAMEHGHDQDEPQTPMWLPALGVALFLAYGIWWATRPTPLPPPEPEAAASASVAASAPPPGAQNVPPVLRMPPGASGVPVQGQPLRMPPRHR